jgi:hypothetical protein
MRYIQTAMSEQARATARRQAGEGAARRVFRAADLPLRHAQLVSLQRAVGNRALGSVLARPVAIAAPVLTVAREKKSIGLGFSELYGIEDDAFGRRVQQQNNLAQFRGAIGAEGPSAFAKGVSSQRVSGGIQQIFTAGIKKAMGDSLKIQQNLAGFTDRQIVHARNHPPMLTDKEVAIAVANFPDLKGYPPGDAQLWNAMGMGDVNTGSWGKDLAAISVWELSHMLHNRKLFEKTEFYYYDASQSTPSTVALTPDQLNDKGVLLNEHDLKELDELGITIKEKDDGWFMWLFGSCLGAE